MTPKVAEFLNLGMRRDVADSKVSNQYVYENYNVRIDTNDGDTTFAATNERGNLYKEITIPGTILGVCELLDGAVIFSKRNLAEEQIGPSVDDPSIFVPDNPGSGAEPIDNPGGSVSPINNGGGSSQLPGGNESPFPGAGGGGGLLGSSNSGSSSNTIRDNITYLKRSGDNYTIAKQYSGNLNFKIGGFFDTLVDYETENVTKVYWVDGVNQPRVIILQEDWDEYDDTSFDFVPEIDKFPHVFIQKEHTSGTGLFKAGIVQYFFTYSNIHGVETAVVYSSPLFYADHKKRAGSPGDFVECQFEISMSNLSQKFDKINIYRAIRTSVNTEVEMVKIANIDITSDSTSIIDDYSSGQAVSPTDLFFKGGDRFVAGTLAAKDSTLFLGNLNVDNSVYEDLSTVIGQSTPIGFGFRTMGKVLEFVDSDAFLDCEREITYTEAEENGAVYHSSNTYLKKGDYYNIGIQLQDKYGKWSEPILFDDFLSPTGVPTLTQIPKQGIFVYTQNIPENILNKYKRIRAVACYPNENRRRFVAQGVLSPTIYNIKDRGANLPYAISSWFFRPMRYRGLLSSETGLEYRHDWLLPSNRNVNCEIQFMEPFMKNSTGPIHYMERARNDFGAEELRSMFMKSNLFAVDASICTLNSPDITDAGPDEEQCDVNIVGYFGTDKVVGDYNITMQTASITNIGTHSNLTPEKSIKREDNNPLATWPLYFDRLVAIDEIDGMVGLSDAYNGKGVAWAVYPWQADRPLGNDWNISNTIQPEEGLPRNGSDTRLRGQYSRKVLGNIKYSTQSNFLNDSEQIQNISSLYYYRNTASNLIKMQDGTAVKNYYAWIDEIFAGWSQSSNLTANGIYTLRYSNGTGESFNVSVEEDNVSYDDFINSNGVHSRRLLQDALPNITYEWFTLMGIEPTLIRYKSTPHCVFKINPRHDNSTNKEIERVLPGYVESARYDSADSLWLNSTITESAIPSFDPEVDGMLSTDDRYWIAEIDRNTDPALMFPKDINDRAFVPVSDIYDFGEHNINIELYGDIRYGRWDCLKTYPYSYDDKNQVIEVLSFMVESKTNLEGRYDRYVETEDVTSIDDSFFNKIDDVYNQKDNLFTYRIQEDWVKENKDFPNQFAWSQTKHSGEEIDTWTSINLASTYQVDGSLGEIRKLIKFGDSLFCFQDKGISQIMFNSNIQLASTSGVPIELANSGKVDGVRYISNVEGAVNPWTIKPGLTGVYFVDDINHSLDKLGGNGIERLSETKGFSDFVHRNHEFRTTWYDNDKKDVHFVTGDKTLCYSEKLGEFTSIYDYGRANIAFNVGDNWNQLYSGKNKLFTARKGDYFYFFDDDKPSAFSITYRIAPQPYDYKIFNTAEYLLRVSSQDGIKHDLVYDSGFHEIAVSTENGDVVHRIDKRDFAQNMNQIKKFNIWRTNIPRFDYFRRADGTSMYLQLSAAKGQSGLIYETDLRNKRYELHNLKVSYLS